MPESSAVLTLGCLLVLPSRIVESRGPAFGLRFAIVVGGADRLTLGVMVAPIRIAIRFPERVRSVDSMLVRSSWRPGFFTRFRSSLVLRREQEHINRSAGVLLKTAAMLALAAPPVVAAAAFIRRDQLTFQEVDVFIPGLPRDLNGLRLVQLSDIHLSPFVSERLLARVGRYGERNQGPYRPRDGRPDQSRGDPLDSCLQQLSRLRSDAGTFGCLGNHEIYADAEDYTTIEGAKLGMRFLRRQSQPLHFGDSILNLVGVDYQRRGIGVSGRRGSI